MYVLRRIPACLSVLLLAAMFLRQGVSLALLLGAVALSWSVLFVPWPPGVQRALGVAVAAMTVPWVLLARVRVDERLARGESWARLLAIFVAVAAFTAWSGWLVARRPRSAPHGVSSPGTPAA